MEPDKPGSWCLKLLKISTSQSYCRTLQSTDTLLDASESVLHRWLLESCSHSFTIYIYLKLAFLLWITEYKVWFQWCQFSECPMSFHTTQNWMSVVQWMEIYQIMYLKMRQWLCHGSPMTKYYPDCWKLFSSVCFKKKKQPINYLPRWS